MIQIVEQIMLFEYHIWADESLTSYHETTALAHQLYHVCILRIVKDIKFLCLNEILYFSDN